ncbi:radical SAM protein [Brevundimonas sp.]|uniref:radical SAM protein n=1 Tax=Brevundimonas sp. TaxID=1871086 RepID=UPI002606A7AB|nr:radical SAM protein [Brevundimonas sp.]
MTTIIERRPRLKIKDPRASQNMHPPDGHRYACPWIEDSLTIHSDGNVSCGLDDPHANRSFGHVEQGSIQEIFANPEFLKLRENLWNGMRCKDCALYQRVEKTPEQVLAPRPQMPSTLVVEPTVMCNLRCPNEACDPNNESPTATRDRSHLTPGSFEDVIAQVRSDLKRVYFFNYGDPFVHRSAGQMLNHLRAECPDAQVITSTNGIPLAKAQRAIEVAASKINSVVFTISGMTQASYERYHRGGRLDLALEGLKNLREASRGNGATSIIWRYLVFNWNDSEEEIAAAVRLAEEIGVDQFSLYLTSIPANGASFRLAPGTPMFERYRRYIDVVHGYHSRAPDADGFYHDEEVPGLGPARWTSWRARTVLAEVRGTLRLSVASLRPSASERVQSVLVRTPWEIYRVPLRRGDWTHAAFPVPFTLRGLGPFPVELLTRDHWFPVEEVGTTDTRCLGVLVRNEPLQESADQIFLALEEETRLFATPFTQRVAQIESGRFLAFDDQQPALT